MPRTGWVVLSTGLVLLTGAAALALAAPRPSSLLERLRSAPADFRAAYSRREAELRAALLPTDDAVARARADVAARRGPTTPDDDGDEAPYAFF